MAETLKSARAKERKTKEHYHHMEIHEAANGGYRVQHMMQREPEMPGGYQPSPHEGDEHVFSTGTEMIGHVMDQHKIKPAEMIAYLKGDNKETPGGNTQATSVGNEVEDEDEEA